MRDRHQKVSHRRLRRRQDVEILRRLRQAALLHDVKVHQHRVPCANKVGLVACGHVALQCACLLAARIELDRLSHDPAFRRDLLGGSRQVWQQHRVEPVERKDAGNPIIEPLAGRTDEQGRARSAQCVAWPPGRDALCGGRGANPRIDALRHRHGCKCRTCLRDQFAVERDLRQRFQPAAHPGAAAARRGPVPMPGRETRSASPAASIHARVHGPAARHCRA